MYVCKRWYKRLFSDIMVARSTPLAEPLMRMSPSTNSSELTTPSPSRSRSSKKAQASLTSKSNKLKLAAASLDES